VKPLLRIGLGGIAAMVIWLLVATAAVAQERGDRAGVGCPAVKTRDLAAPMGGFPAIRHVPSPGHFPFGPTHLQVTGLGDVGNEVQAGGGWIGFRVEPQQNWTHRRHLGWDVRLRVTRLSGADRGLVAERLLRLSHSQEVGREEAKVAALVPGSPAFYRLDLTFSGPHGKVLGSYSEYVRVVRATVNARLALSGHQFSPGAILRTRIENRGSVVLSFELNDLLTLEQKTAAGWKAVPEEPSWHGLPVTTGFIFGGEAGPCHGLRLPASLPAGPYRVSALLWARGHSFSVRAHYHVR
jgi:hypothetical protein